MATYKEIFGTNIEVLASDPANPVEGQVWYNSTSNVVKGQVFQAASWATGGDLGTGKRAAASAGVSSSSGLAIGGEIVPGGFTGTTESYNGSAWTEVNDLNTPRGQFAGAGTQTSAIAFGGRAPAISNASESWNGTSWTSTPSINTARRYQGGAGADNTSGLCFGGLNAAPGGSSVASNELWNGSSWTEVGDLNTAKQSLGGTGIATSALAVAGDGPPVQLTQTETWNGTSWTEVNDLNTGVQSNAAAGLSTSAALSFGGSTAAVPAGTTQTEEWDGTSWTIVASMNVGNRELSGTGTTSSALAFGGAPDYTQTEEWSAATTTPVTFTDS